jgi:branched-chain amino acid transport system substrate-binding protein
VRGFLKAAFSVVATATLAVAWAGPSAIAKARSATLPPLKIGFLYPQTGVFAAPGQFMYEGLTLFLRQHNYELAGRKIQVITADTQGNPNVAITQAEKLIEQDHVNLLFGPLTAAEGTALVQVIDRSRIPAIYPIVSSDDLTQRTISPYIVRTGWTSSQTTQPLGWYAYHVLHYRRVAVIAYDFSFGWESVGGFVNSFQHEGGHVVKEIWTPLTTTNFAPYLSQIPTNVDAVFASFSGSTAINFFQQYKEFGLKLPIIAQGNSTDESTLTQTGPSALGVVTALHYSADLQTPDNQRFVKAYVAMWHHEPSYYSEGTYVGGMFLLAGLKAMHGNISNTLAFIAAMKHAHITGAPRGPITMDSYGNPVENVYIRKVEEVHGQLQNVVIYTFHNVSQFWHWTPQQFLKQPVYSRSFPAINP